MIESHRRIFNVSVVLLLAAILRLIDLGSSSIWSDEALEFWTASYPLDVLLDRIRFSVLDPPLYSLFLHIWIKFGLSELHLRLPSLIMSLLGVGGAIALGERLGGQRSGLLAGILMAVSPVDIRYAQEIGQYTMMAAFVFWNYVFLFDIHNHDQPHLRSYVGWVFLGWLACFSHYGAWIAVISPFAVHITIQIIRKNWKGLRKDLLSMGLLIVGILPLLIFYLPAQLDWRVGSLPQTSNIAFSPMLLKDILRIGYHITSFLFTGWPYTHIPEWIPVGILGVLVLENALIYWRSPGRYQSWFLMLLVTIVFFAIIGVFGIYPGYGRYGLFLLAFWIPFIAYKLNEWVANPLKRWFAGSFFLVLIAISLISSPQRSLRNLFYPDEIWPWPEINYDIKPAFNHWVENRHEGEPIYIYYRANLVFSFYLRQNGLDDCGQPPLIMPCPPGSVIYGEWIQHKPKKAKIASVKQALSDAPDQLWIFFKSVSGNEDVIILKGLMDEYRVTEQVVYRGAKLYHLRTRTAIP